MSGDEKTLRRRASSGFVRGLLGVGLVLVFSGAVPVVPATARGAGSPIRSGFPLIFDSERIQLGIVGDSLEVTGTYYLVCRFPFDEPLSLFYPFPKDSLLGGARMVDFRLRAGGGEERPARWEAVRGDRGVRWWLPSCSGDTLVAVGVYRQKILDRYARYIVTTTRAWDRPLRRARFEIRLPEGTEPVEFSFPFEKVGGERPFYVYEAEQFLPDRDITVRWAPASP